jgi:S-DNA-T family DNA segregation ATPase FtsK/SpoIIIE
MLFFLAALAHQYAPEIKVMDGLKETFLSGGMIGKSMHELLFYELFGSSSTLIYIGIILVSFSIASSASWKNISIALFKRRPRLEKTAKSAKKEKVKPEIISSKAFFISRNCNNGDSQKRTLKSQNSRKTEKQKKLRSLKKNKAAIFLKSGHQEDFRI